jgi:RND family efflux transporter MFP subunit
MNTETRPLETELTRVAASAPNAIPQHPRASRSHRYTVIGGVAIVLAAGLALGVLPRVRAQSRLATEAAQVARPLVNVTNVAHHPVNVQLSLPGDVRAFEETKIYARADGYLLKWNTDIGARVEAGQILGEIDTPELDQELNQSRAALAQSQANLILARSSAERWRDLLKDHAVSEQEVDEKNSALAAREADVAAAQASVARLEKLTSFKTVRAPFSGTVTRRYVDTGALIRTSSSVPLFEIAQTETLRVQVNVPQAYLRDIAIGSPVEVAVAEYPDRTFAGKVLRVSGAFDPTTRTMLTEIEVPNRKSELFPGIHVDVQLSLAAANPPLIVPATAVIVRSDGVHVAKVDDASSIRLLKVQLGRDLGRTVEVVAGIQDGERIVTNPTDTLVDGTVVRVAGAAQVASASGTHGPQLARR